MCGFASVFNLNGESVSRDLIKRMADRLNHRGPDADGIYVSENFGVGHKRLSILDTSEKGNQPMQSKSGDWILAFNGCIYNYMELRVELRALGYSFHSNGDTEVLVEGLDAFGTDFFTRLNGMFAVLAWHVPTKTLYLSRDRFGVKPLYYFFDGARILIASEIKAFLEHPKFKVEMDHESLNEYFTFQNMFSFKTLFRGVCMLPPANTVKIDSSTKRITHSAWWDYDFSQPDNEMTFDEAVKETERLMKQAVSRQMVSDVPVGSYLSGGMDSGAITGIASSHVPRLATFTCGFDMSEVTGVEANYDERRDAELMANHFRTEQYEQVINAGDLRWSLPRLVWHLEDLRVGMSYPNYYISRLASKFVKVCLQGTGGDELFGGYPWRYYRVFKSIGQEEFFESYYQFWQRLVSDERKHELFTPDTARHMDFQLPKTIFKRVFTFNDRLRYDTPEDHIQNSLYFEIKTFLPGLLIVGDKLSMAHGLEERFPFLDNDLVNFAMSVPVKYKLGRLEEMKTVNENQPKKARLKYTEFDDGKNVLRRAMADLLPPRIIDRKKQGFSAPDESWYRGENVNYIKDLLLTKKTLSSEFISRKFMEATITDHLEGKANNRLLIWSFMNLEMWSRIFLENQKIE